MVIPGVVPSQCTEASYKGKVDRNRKLVEGKAQQQDDGIQDEQKEKDGCGVG
jgi:hypothetical protein